MRCKPVVSTLGSHFFDCFIWSRTEYRGGLASVQGVLFLDPIGRIHYLCLVLVHVFQSSLSITIAMNRLVKVILYSLSSS